MAAASALSHAARPMLRFIDGFKIRREGDERALLDEAADLLLTFEADAKRAAAHPMSIKPARYGLAVLLDQKARQTEGVSLGTWSVLARSQLFEGRDMSLARIRDFQQTAAQRGGDFADLERFLDEIITQAEDRRHGHKRIDNANWGLRIGAYVVALVLGLVAYAVFLEVRFQQKLTAIVEADIQGMASDDAPDGPALVRQLSDLRAIVARTQRAAETAPFRGAIRLPFADAARLAEARYQETIDDHLPRTIAAGIEEVLATSGDSLVLYDALRAWAVVTEEVDWSQAYLQGWVEDNGANVGLDTLAPHVGRLTAGDNTIVPVDVVVMEQARGFAAEVPEPDRAWLELLRDAAMRALPDWMPEEAVPGISNVLTRRTGTPMNTGIPGLFTADGWVQAQDKSVGVSVLKAREMAPIITGQTLPSNNTSPDLLLDRLHVETIQTWQDWLADLRVQPFTQREKAILISGALAAPENHLTRLLRQVWVQTGGTDRGRTHAQQITVGRAFGAMIQYVEQGGMADIARLFSTLNVALGAADVDPDRAARKLMSLQDRNRSILTLERAPRVVVLIAEDVLAQSSRTDQSDAGGSLNRVWKTQVFPTCRNVVSGRYPFAAASIDAAPGDVAALLGPQGALRRFVETNAQQDLDTSQSPWRWKPEASFEGLNQDSAAFLEQAMQLSRGLYGEAGLSHDFTLAALAERGQTMFAIGGDAQPVRATGAPARLNWPGPRPEMGVDVSFRDASDAPRITYPGPWGLMRLLDTLRLRIRDNGARVLLDLRSESGRVFLEMSFASPLNPVSVRPGLRDFACPQTL